MRLRRSPWACYQPFAWAEFALGFLTGLALVYLSGWRP